MPLSDRAVGDIVFPSVDGKENNPLGAKRAVGFYRDADNNVWMVLGNASDEIVASGVVFARMVGVEKDYELYRVRVDVIGGERDG